MRAARTRVRVKAVKRAAAASLTSPATPAYEAASITRRAAGWPGGGGSANAALLGNATTLRNRARQLVRNNPWAAHAVDVFAAECVGTGIRPQSKAADRDFQERAQELWDEWTGEADADGVTTFYGQQDLGARSLPITGEYFLRLRPRRPQDGLSVPLQVQLLEADHVPLWLTRIEPNGNVTRAGIEFDRIGRRAAYWIYREHPGEPAMTFRASELVRVPADQVAHVFRPERPGQIRGVPWLAPVLVKLLDLDAYEDAELMRKKIAAMFTAFVKQPAPENATATVLGEGEKTKDNEALEVGLEPGSTMRLEPGEEMEFAQPADVGDTYEDFLKWQLRGAAAGIGLTYEQLTGDLSGVNFSSIRAGLLTFRRRCRAIQQNTIAHQMCRPVWRAWLRQAVLAGALRAPGFAAAPSSFVRARWVPQGWDWVDPIKEQQAQREAVRDGFKSRQQVVSEMGRDVDDVDREMADDNARADGLGLVLDSDPRRTARSGSTQAADAGEPADDEERDERRAAS